jgi:replication factor C large subunit
MTELWTDQFFPNDVSEFIGNQDIVESLRSWGEKWEAGKPQKPLLLFGATGTGKTCLAILMAQYFGWQLFELNASDTRTKDVIEKVAGAASQGSSFSGKKRLILLDEVDGLQGNSDRGGVAAINKVIKQSKNPVLLTANEVYGNQKMTAFRSSCELIQFKKINYLSIAKRLRELLECQKLEFDPEAVKLLAQNSAGDFRSALLDLQTLSLSGPITLEAVGSLGYRERQQDVFKTMGQILKGNSVKEIRQSRFKSDLDSRMLFNWIEENIPRHFTKGEDSAKAFERLSRADVFNGRIRRRQHYGFLRYSSELMTSGVSLSREHDYSGWIQYQFPGLLRKLGSSKSARNLRKELGQKIGEKIHSSSRAFQAYDLPFLQVVFSKKDKAIALSAALDLNEAEIAFLCQTKPTTKKVKTIFEKAQELRQKEFLERRAKSSPLEEKEPIEEEPKEQPQQEKPDENQTRLF